MTAVLRTAAGEVALYQAGRYFSGEQGEWLARPPGWGAWDRRLPSRDAALRLAAARVIRRARMRCRLPDHHPPAVRISTEGAATAIAWALRIAGRPARHIGMPIVRAAATPHRQMEISLA